MAVWCPSRTTDGPIGLVAAYSRRPFVQNAFSVIVSVSHVVVTPTQTLSASITASDQLQHTDDR